MAQTTPEQVDLGPRYSAQEFHDPNFFASIAVPAMRDVARHYHDNEAIHYGGRDGNGVYVGVCGAFETPGGEVILLGGSNTKLDPSFEKICGEKGVLKKARMLREGLGGGRLLSLYVMGPDDQKLTAGVLGINAPTLHPCKGKCQHAIADHEAVTEDLMIVSATRSDNYVEEFYLLRRLLSHYEGVEVVATSDQLVAASRGRDWEGVG